jgi:hypothetical protein
MPTISLFYGIAIRIYVQDHNPPHFHAVYGDAEARFTIPDFAVMDAGFPRTATRLVKQWAGLHVDELTRNWARAQNSEAPVKIDGLDVDENN